MQIEELQATVALKLCVQENMKCTRTSLNILNNIKHNKIL